MRSLFAFLRDALGARKKYHHEAGRDIAYGNLRTLRTAALLTLLLLTLFLLIAPLMIPGWAPSPVHLAFWPVSAAVLAAVTFYARRPTPSSRAVTLLCTLFESVLLCFCLLIDTVGAAGAPAAFLPLLVVILPLLFIFPFTLSFGLVTFFTAVFIALVIVCKPREIGQYDIFGAVVALLFSLASDHLVTAMRVREHDGRMRYQLLSTRDSLSSLYNKQACTDAIQRYLRACNPTARCAFAVIDLDDFKAVNDTAGHLAGDVVLQKMGELLQEVFRSSDIIGRFGGDEFVVLAKDVASRAVMEEKCRLIRERLRQLSERTSTPVTCSQGVVLVNGCNADYDSLFKQADGALYAAKKQGKNRHVIRPYTQA
ncbi:MAG TPA: GGDEF domain-containing protein [Candidatus Pullichristensenella avicola]|nr:GGDEF domain-containing protein [Candidatus Pullichristensenella avicola]